MTSIRYIVQRAATRRVLTYDAPIVAHTELSRQLSKSGRVDLFVSPDVGVTQVADDGHLLYEKWGTIVTIEEDGQLTFRGIVDKVTFDGASSSWQISCPSIATYPYGLAYEGQPYYGAQVDPADVMRLVWAHVQSFPDSNLAVTVRGSTPVKLGSFSLQTKIDAEKAYTNAVNAYTAANNELKRLRGIVAASRKEYSARVATRTAKSKALTAAKAIRPKNPGAVATAQADYNAAVLAAKQQNDLIGIQQRSVDAQAKVVAARRTEKAAASKKKSDANAAMKADGGAYQLLWWEAPDCGGVIDDLAQKAPLDWLERHYWSGDEPRTEIVVAYPRAGRRLSAPTDPIFEQGVNIAIPIDPEDDGDDYANALYGIGAGEGAGSLRRTTGRRDGRLRRSKVFTDKSEKWAGSMDRRLAVELNTRMRQLGVTKVTVIDHENSRPGTYNLGDDVLVKGNVPHLGTFQDWHRIVGMTQKRDGTTELDVVLSSTFTYGKGIDE